MSVKNRLSPQEQLRIFLESLKDTDKNGRYPHPYATIKDINGQKCGN